MATNGATSDWKPEGWTPPGYRLAYHRKLAGLTQQELGERVGKTQGWVSQAEKGIIPLDRITQLDDLARAVGVSRYVLTGEPASARSTGDMDALISVTAIRRSLLLPDEPVAPRELVRLQDMADQAMRARMHCDYRSLGALLPALLADARTLCETPATHEQGLRLLVRGAVTGALAVKPLGYVDLALLLAERAETAAAQLGDPVYIAAAQFAMAQCVMANGNANRQSLLIATRAADDIAAAGTDPDAVAWRTMNLLHAGLAAALLHDDDRSRDFMDAAAGVVRQVEGDPWRMEANPSNVALWRLSAAVSNGHPERADALARQVDPTGLRTPQRRARWHMDHAVGLYLEGKYPEATVLLQQADRVAPDDIRRRGSVKVMVREMVAQTRRRPAGIGHGWTGGPPEGLHDLAVKVGVGPDGEESS